jgi:hypothetical protein
MCTAETNCGFIFHFSLSLPFVYIYQSRAQPFQFCGGECAHIKERLDKMTTNEVATRPPLAHDQVPRCWLPTGYNAKSSGTLRTIYNNLELNIKKNEREMSNVVFEHNRRKKHNKCIVGVKRHSMRVPAGDQQIISDSLAPPRLDSRFHRLKCPDSFPFA